MASDRPPRSSSLLKLPGELLHMVWQHLQLDTDDDAEEASASRDQHALSALSIAVDYNDEETTHRWRSTLRCAQRQLAAFPASARLTSLRWDLGYLGGGASSVVLPELLPEFFGCVTGRLANVSSVTLQGELALGYGEISSLVDVCPRLADLTLEDGPVLGRALAPLTRLSGLKALSLLDVEPQSNDVLAADLASIYAPLAPLSGLTRLQVVAVCAEEILPYLEGLTSLQDLRLQEPHVCTAAGHAGLHHLSQLTQLTSLCLDFCSNPLTLTPATAVAVTPSSRLVRLCLGGATVPTPVILLIAALPHLADLTAAELAPDCDLSSLTSSYTRLTLLRLSSPLQLTHLPLSSVKLLVIGWFTGACHDNVTWQLDATAPLDATYATLQRACEILACRVSSRDLHLVLDCAPAASLPHSSPSSASPAPLLAALAPFQHAAWAPQLVLGTNWDVSSEHAQQLAAHLPILRSLQVSDAFQTGFASFMAAVGVELPRLRCLKVGDRERAPTGELPQPSQNALLALASLWAVVGPHLTITVVNGGMSGGQVERCNAALALISSRGKSRHKTQVVVRLSSV